MNFNFVHGNITEKDKDLFFGPDLHTEIFISIENTDKTMAHLLAKARVFPSIGQAKKNGWNKDIPQGFSAFKVGKNWVSILN